MTARRAALALALCLAAGSAFAQGSLRIGWATIPTYSILAVAH